MRISTVIAAITLIATLWPSEVAAQDTSSARRFSSELQIPVVYQAPLDIDPSFGIGLDYTHYFGTRFHAARYPNRFAEELQGPISWVRAVAAYQPHADLEPTSKGYSITAEGVKTIGGPWGVGAGVTYDRSTSVDGESLNDFEAGPYLSYWSGQRTHVTLQIKYRRIDNYRLPVVGTGGDTRVTDEFVQVRHHLVYVPGEDWRFSYAQDLGLRVGILGTPHTNNLRLDNHFIYSFMDALSLGPKVGVNLDYLIGPATSVLTIPVGGRMEYFMGGIVAVGEIGYDVATMSGQQTGGLSFRGTLGYRF